MTFVIPRAERPAMSDYGVPEDLDGVLPWSWAEERLAACRNFWVVTASADARPHAMPTWGYWQPVPARFVLSCSPNSRKARNLAANPQMTVAVDDSVEVVVVEGRAAPVDPAAVDDALTSFAAKYWPAGQEAEDAKAFLAGHLVLAMTPERAFGIIEDEVDFTRRATRWVW